jgi:hypothetical protein
MKYTVKNAGGNVLPIPDAENLIEAVTTKHHIQRSYNKLHGVDEIFTVAKTTSKEDRAFKEAGWLVGPKGSKLDR